MKPNSSRPSARIQALAWLVGLGLLFVHLFVGRDLGPNLRFGWIPDELLLRMAWLGAAWLYLLFFCAVIWRPPGR